MKSSYTPLNFGLGETIDMLRDHVNAFATEHIAPIAADIDRDNQFPNHLWSQFGEMGLLGVTVDEEFGGAGMGYLAHVVAMEEISRASASIALSYGAHSNLCVNTKVGMRTIAERDRRRSSADLFHRNNMSKITHACTAKLFVDGYAKQAHFAKLGPQMIGELVIAVDVCGDGGDMLGGERVDVVSEHIDGFTKPKVEWGVAAFHNISLLKVLISTDKVRVTLLGLGNYGCSCLF